MNINIKIDGLDKALKRLDPKIIQRASQRAIERAASSGKTIISSQIREKFNIKKSDLDRKIVINKPWSEKLKAEIIVGGLPISLIHFGAKQIAGNIQTFVSKDKGIAQKRLKRTSKFGGIKVNIIKGKETKLKSAFIARGKGGNPLVFRRIGGKRLPIRALKVISFPSILTKSENMQKVIRRIKEQLKKEFDSAVDYYQSKQK